MERYELKEGSELREDKFLTLLIEAVLLGLMIEFVGNGFFVLTDVYSGDGSCKDCFWQCLLALPIYWGIIFLLICFVFWRYCEEISFYIKGTIVKSIKNVRDRYLSECFLMIIILYILGLIFLMIFYGKYGSLCLWVVTIISILALSLIFWGIIRYMSGLENVGFSFMNFLDKLSFLKKFR